MPYVDDMTPPRTTGPGAIASLALFLGLLAAACSESAVAPGTADDGSPTAEVVQVVDGDTIEVRLPDGRLERVRLIGIDAPELGEPGSSEATARLTELVEGEEIRLEADVSDRDRFDRLLRYVMVGEVFVNETLVREGLAAAVRYPPDTERAETLEAAEAVARGRQSGLWGVVEDPVTTDPQPMPRGSVLITDVRFDAAGNDIENANDEWVQITNTGSEPADLSNWELTDEGPNHAFTFPGGFLLDPGADVRVLSGCGDPTPDRLYFCVSGSAVWNNDGDTASLYDASGSLVDSRSDS